MRTLLHVFFTTISLLWMSMPVWAQSPEPKSSEADLLPLGTTWYYNTDERAYVDHPYRFGYIRHRVERNVEISGYQAQELSVLYVDYEGKETPRDPIYIHRNGGKRYVIEDAKLRLLYDSDAELGDLVPLPVHPDAYEIPGFERMEAVVIDKKIVEINGRKLVQQTYRLDFYMEEGLSTLYKKFAVVTEDIGSERFDELYASPQYYSEVVDFWIDPFPRLRCFSSEDYLYKTAFWIHWGNEDCDYYGYANPSPSPYYYALGTEWYYGIQNSVGGPSPGYLRHRIDRNLIVNNLPVQELTILNELMPLSNYPAERDTVLIHYNDGKMYLLDSDTLRLMYDLKAEVGDTIPIGLDTNFENLGLPVNTYYPLYSADVVLVEKEQVNIAGVELLKQTYDYRIKYLIDGVPTQVDMPQREMIERIGGEYPFVTLPRIYPLDYVSDEPTYILRCYNEGGLMYHGPHWNSNNPCDFVSVESVSNAESQLRLYYDKNTKQLHLAQLPEAAVSYKLYSVSGKQLQVGRLSEWRDLLQLSSYPAGTYLFVLYDEAARQLSSASFFID